MEVRPHTIREYHICNNLVKVANIRRKQYENTVYHIKILKNKLTIAPTKKAKYKFRKNILKSKNRLVRLDHWFKSNEHDIRLCRVRYRL